MNKKILFLTIHLPYPPDSGASMYNTYRVLELLRQSNQIFLASLLKHNDKSNTGKFLQETGIEEYYFEELNIERTKSATVKSFIKGVPLNVFRNSSKNFHQKIRSIANQYDILWVDHYEAFQYVPEEFKGKVILRAHNAWHVMWRRYAEVAGNLAHKIFASIESKRVAKVERKCCDRADLVLCASSDGEFLEPDLTVRAKKFREFMFLGDDCQLNLPVPAYETLEDALIYVGTLSWEANVDGLLWFVQGCWQELRQQYPELTLYLIGSNPDPRLMQLAEIHQGIVLTGFVENLEEYFTRCKINIIPLRFGSGIKVKLINGLYRGIPIVTTDTGIESIPVKPGEDLLVANNHQTMIESISGLLKDAQHWKSISDNARSTARDQFTWEQLSTKLDGVLKELER
jgi:glycosyltransferase involved in cell wall biosynthesis